jgi:methionyl-tRNA formyltransferase
MRVAVLLNRDVHANLALNLLLPTLRRHEVGLFLSDAVGRAAPTVAPLAVLRQLEQTIPNALWAAGAVAVRGPVQEGELLDFERAAEALGASCQRLPDPNGPDGVARLGAFAPDVVVSIRYGHILRAPAIGVPRLGVLNLHGGILPAFRGVLATFRALQAGAPEIGCTLHWIVDAGIDSGPIVEISRGPAPAAGAVGGNLFDAIQSLYPAGCEMVCRALEGLERGERLGGRPPEGPGGYYSWPTAEEFAEVRARGYRLFDPASYLALLRRYGGAA